MNVAVVLGTRPEAVKLASVILALQERAGVTVCATGQHPDIADSAPGGIEGLRLIPAVGYSKSLALLAHADFGGLQEEAPSFGVSVLVIRDKTERPQAVEAGLSRLIGTEPRQIGLAISQALAAPRPPTPSGNPFGGRWAAARIVTHILGTTP